MFPAGAVHQRGNDALSKYRFRVLLHYQAHEAHTKAALEIFKKLIVLDFTFLKGCDVEWDAPPPPPPAEMISVPAVLADGKVTDDSSHSHEDGAPPPNASPIYGVACQKVTPETGAQSTTPAPRRGRPARRTSRARAANLAVRRRRVCEPGGGGVGGEREAAGQEAAPASRVCDDDERPIVSGHRGQCTSIPHFSNILPCQAGNEKSGIIDSKTN